MHYASCTQRFAAYLIDAGLFGVLVYWPVHGLVAGVGSYVFFALVLPIYFIASECSPLQASLGKYCLKIYVAD